MPHGGDDTPPCSFLRQHCVSAQNQPLRLRKKAIVPPPTVMMSAAANRRPTESNGSSVDANTATITIRTPMSCAEAVMARF